MPTWNDIKNEMQQNTIKVLKEIKSEYLKINITDEMVHTKLFIKDGTIAVESSANFTITSLWHTTNSCTIHYKKEEVQERLDSFNSVWYTS